MHLKRQGWSKAGTFGLGLLVFGLVGHAAERRVASFLETRFRQLDSNSDGKLTRAESGNADWFGNLDRDNDGIIAHEELRQAGKLLQPKAGGDEDKGRLLFQWLDKNGDGRLSKDELPRPEQFERLDLNRDGGVTYDEASAALAGFKPQSPVPGTAATEDSPRQGPDILKPGDVGVGRLLPELSFTDIAGRPGSLGDYRPGKALVIALTTTSCPVGRRLAPALAKLERDYSARGVSFLFVNPTETDTLASIQADIQTQGFKGRYVHDTKDALVQVLEARSTTEVFVVDAARTLVYRGAVSDQYGLGYSLDEPRETYLADALDALLAGRAPRIAATTAPGCALDLAAPLTVAGNGITYHNRISRILQNNCQECHRQGGVAPFTLVSFEDAKSHAGMMRKQVERGVMPPWFAAPEPGGTHSPWINDRSLSAEDKRDLLAWLASDQPLGNPADAPLPRTFPTGWQIGTPDLVLQLPRPVPIKADGVMPYQNITIETGITEDKWVQGFELQPTAREVVHHILVFIRPPARPAEGRFDDSRAERDGFFAAYVPGNSFRRHPEGFAKLLPAGSRLHFQIHYTPTGKATTDQTRLGIKFAAAPPSHMVKVAGISNPLINIPPGAADHTEHAQITVPFDAHALAFMPHMHLRGKAFKFEAEFPGGEKRVLLDVPRFDFNWQLSYELAEPLKLPAGTRIRTTAIFDNSAGNPANPDPAAIVRWGQQTFNEMMLGYLEYYTPNDQSISSEKAVGRKRAGLN